MIEEFTLKVSPQQLQVITIAMHKAPVPYEIIAPVLNALQAQITEQEMTAQQPQRESEPRNA